MSELMILSGLPASGKSTVAREWVEADPTNRTRLNYDDLRIELYGPDWKFNYNEEWAMQTEARKRVWKWLQSGLSVVIDNTNLNSKARDRWAQIGHENGAIVTFNSIDTPAHICVERDRNRPAKATTITATYPWCSKCNIGYILDKILPREDCAVCHGELEPNTFITHESARVGQAVIDRMALFTSLIDFNSSTYGYRPFILVDMDGTLADCEWRRKLAFEAPPIHLKECSATNPTVDRQCPECGAKSKKNWPLFLKDVDQDPPIQPIVDLVNVISPFYNIIIVSGRDLGSCGPDTENWLYEHLCIDGHRSYKHLFMRSAGDSREDSIIKKEILDRLPKDRIAFVLDDRDQVVKMWRENGLRCLQVAPGAF